MPAPISITNGRAADAAALARALAPHGEDVAKVVVYGPTTPAELAAMLPAPRPALSVVPVPALTDLAWEAVVCPGRKQRVGTGPFPDGVRCGDLVLTSAHTAPSAEGVAVQTEHVMARLGETLAALGTGYADVVKVNIYYVGTGTAADWEIAARVRARAFPEPGPAATGIPVPRLGEEAALTQIEVWAQPGARPRRFSWPEGHWDWPIHLPYKHGNAGGGLSFVGGQVSLGTDGLPIDFDDLAKQTATSLANIDRVLAGLGASADDVIAMTAFYEGDGSEHLDVPASTVLVPLPCLAYDGMVVEIEVVGTVSD
jgi:enamine deaminase RidA (YjgF/YER057c/UK114 family)